MSYVKPSDLVVAMTDAGEAKIRMSTSDTLAKAAMGGAMLSVAAAFAVTISVTTGVPLLGAVLFPVGFALLYLLGYDLLTGVLVLGPTAARDRPPGSAARAAPRSW